MANSYKDMSDHDGDRPGEEEFGEEEELERNYGEVEGEEEMSYHEGEEEGMPEGAEEMFEEVNGAERDEFLRRSQPQGGDDIGNDRMRHGADEGEEEWGNQDPDRENEDQVEELDEENQGDNYEGWDPDEDDDFPEYANEKNKKMNEDIKFTRRNAKQLQDNIEDTKERLGIMKEHQKYILLELKNTQAKIEMKNEETDAEKHLSQIADRKIGKITADLRKLDQDAIENQDRLNDIQQQIFKGNDQLEKLKLEVNWNKEEKEQWIVAVKQKEDDNMTLAKFKRKDDNKIKELSLTLEKLTVQKNKFEFALEKEVTETQARQIEIDKAAEEFKKHHAERHRIYAQWDEAIQNIAYRHEATLKITTENVTIQMQMKNAKDTLREKKEQLEREKNAIKKEEESIKAVEREILDLKGKYELLKDEEVDLNADVKINQNTLSADSSKLAEKKNMMEMLEKELQNRKQRLTNAEKKYKAQVEILKSEDAIEKAAKSRPFCYPSG
jgi:chromosome segregation ATPase